MVGDQLPPSLFPLVESEAAGAATANAGEEAGELFVTRRGHEGHLWCGPSVASGPGGVRRRGDTQFGMEDRAQASRPPWRRTAAIRLQAGRSEDQVGQNGPRTPFPGLSQMETRLTTRTGSAASTPAPDVTARGQSVA